VLAARILIRGLDDGAKLFFLGSFASPTPFLLLRRLVDKVSPAGCDELILDTTHHVHSVTDFECR
jgi:hypothetical protein